MQLLVNNKVIAPVSTDMESQHKRPQSRPSLHPLGSDLLIMIVDILSPIDIQALRLVSSAINKVARYGLYRKLDLGYEKAALHKTEQLLASLSSNELLPAVRSLDVTGPRRTMSWYPNTLDSKNRAQAKSNICTKMICSAMGQMTGLKHLYWYGSCVPNEILSLLAMRPEMKLSVDTNWQHEDSHLLSLVGCQNLHALDVGCRYGTAEDCLEVTKPLRQILLTCHNLRRLKLDIAQPQGGCEVYYLPKEYHGIGLRNGERPPPLEELEIVNYPFGFVPENGQSDSTLGYPADRYEMQYWTDMFDWSRLRRLRADRKTIPGQLAPKLTALEELYMTQDYWPAALPQDLPTKLKVLELEGTAAELRQDTLEQGDTLRRLKLHQTEDDNGSWNNLAINDTFLLDLRTHCPNIEELALDMPRHNKDWPYSTLDILSTLPRLHTVELWFELGPPNAPAQPYVTFSAAAHLFTYLHSRNKQIQHLTVHSGAPSDLGYGYPSDYALWPQDNTATFTCSLSRRDDEASKGVFTTTYKSVWKKETESLRRLLRRYPDGGITCKEALAKFPEDFDGLNREEQGDCVLPWDGPRPLRMY